MSKTRLVALLVAICAVIGLAGVAAPANAATTDKAAVVAATANTSSEKDPASTTPAARAPGFVPTAGVHPDYPAGAYYYVCVGTDGSQVTVLYNEKTAQVCNGAAAIQQWLESGQFVQTIQLTASGRPATATFDPSEDCFLAILAGGVPLLFEPLGGALFIWDGAATIVTAGRECVSN